MPFQPLIQALGSLRGTAALVLALAAGTLGACGGGGSGAFGIGTNALSITSTAITEAPSGLDVNSQFESADPVNWPIPLSGGCGGPYVIKVVSGSLPPGISAVGGTEGAVNLHHLRGTILQHGNYTFRLEITDTACAPFEFTSADFAWSVLQGQVTIVTALPKLYAPGTYDVGSGVKNPVYPALPDTVYASPTVFEFVIAGGTPPYSIDVVDDPNNPDDGDPLPGGMTIPPFSRNIVGSPIEIQDGIPYIISLRATDGNGQQTAPFTFQWEITAPPIFFIDSSMPNAKCGEPYFMGFQIKDGVPPFAFQLVKSDVLRDVDGEPDVVYQSPLNPIITPATATQNVTAANYPTLSAPGPDYRANLVPPEGLRFGDNGGNSYAASGALAGIPRRRGQFAMYVYCRSTTAPTASGQHNWKYFELTSEVSEPPNAPIPPFGQDPVYTKPGAFSPVQPYASIADAEQGVSVYNPDTATHSPAGLQLRAVGGVRKDGLTDSPNASGVTDIDGLGLAQEDGSTVGGGYDWTVNPNPAGDGDIYTTLPAGMVLDEHTGVWRVANSALLKGQQAQALEFTVFDQQLPTGLRNSQVQRVNFAVGPDKLIITESTTSGTSSTSTSGRRDMEDGNQTVRVCLPYSGLPPVVRNLDNTDLTATHTVPSTTGLSGTSALATLLTGQDILRASVNPSGWWDDIHNLNSMGARSGIHADNNNVDLYYYGENDYGSSSDYSRQPSATCVDMPAYRPGAFNAVTQDALNGVFTNGGRLYPFANSSYFGVFMIRSDASIYVPFAIGTSQTVDGQTFNGFGDHQLAAVSASSTPSQARAMNMAVSPDGRFAAVKIKNSATNYTETANNSRIVIFSLTGEKLFGGQTWTVVKTGSVGNTTTGTYLYGASLVMTNSHVYFLCGNRYGTYTSSTSSRDHYVYRFAFVDPTTGSPRGPGYVGAAGATGTASFCTKADVGETSWTNTLSAPMQTRFQLFYSPWSGAQVYNSAMTLDGQNVTENGIAPLPFRVSADGRAVAILAMPDVVVATSANAQAWHVWVDFQGNGVRRLSSAPLHVTGGGTRGYMLGRGCNYNMYENWHTFGGPTSQFEISDDASKVAVVANRYAGSFSTTESSWTVWATAREDVIAFKTSTWASWSELPVTGDNLGTNVFSASGGAIWRFGALTFTKDNKGLVFWGGFSQWWPASTSYSYQYNHIQAGTLYGTDISSATLITGLTITSLLPTADGGSSAGVASYTTTSAYNPTLATGTLWDTTAGVIKPMGGFVSRNREFMYIMNKGGLQANGHDYGLIGVNIRSVNTLANVNGKTDFRGFGFSTSWPQRRGFMAGTYAAYAYYGMYYTDYPGHRKQGCGKQIMPKANGWVFFASQYQSGGPMNYNTYYLYGPANTTYTYDYASYGGEIEAFNADVGGPIVRLSSHGGDTSLRRMHFIEPFDGGDSLAYVYDTYTTSYSSPAYEQLHAIRGIALHPTSGALTGTLVRAPIETVAGRVSDAVSFGSTSDRLYYAYGTASNENAKQVKEATISPAGAVTLKTLTTLARRYNVLFAAR